MGDADWMPWCYVQGSKANCDAAQDSLNMSEPLDWRSCSTCACMNNWNYQGNMNFQCYNDTVWGSAWCYVDGYTTCASVKTAYKDSGCCGNPTGTYTAPMM